MSEIDEKIKMAVELTKIGKIDHEASMHLMERLHAEKQRLMEEQAKRKMASDVEDAFSYGSAIRGGRRKSPTYEDKLCMRMGWHDITDIPKNLRLSMVATANFIHLTIVPLASEEAVVIKDDINLFPSDMVVTQLRMLSNG